MLVVQMPDNDIVHVMIQTVDILQIVGGRNNTSYLCGWVQYGFYESL